MFTVTTVIYINIHSLCTVFVPLALFIIVFHRRNYIVTAYVKKMPSFYIHTNRDWINHGCMRSTIEIHSVHTLSSLIFILNINGWDVETKCCRQGRHGQGHHYILIYILNFYKCHYSLLSHSQLYFEWQYAKQFCHYIEIFL